MTIDYVGPFGFMDVIVDGRRVPFLEAIPAQGGMVYLSIDRRYGLDLSVADAERVIPFVAHCIAVGLGYVGFPEDGEPVARQHMPRVHKIDTEETT